MKQDDFKNSNMAKTLFDKIWDAHIVKQIDDEKQVIYIDQHFIHEVTSPQAFAGLDAREISPFRTDKILATADHNVPTINQHLPINEPMSKLQVDTLMSNCLKHDINCYGLGHEKQGIVHVIGPELGYTKPGMTIVCGDSHTSTHGAFGCIAFGIGTTQVEQVMATQCLILSKPKKMRITIDGQLNPSISSKDIVLYILSKIGTAGGTGYFIEFAGEAIESLSMEARMTICNMSIEMGARGGMIAPDQVTFDYLEGREQVPSGEQFEDAVSFWKTLYSEPHAVFDAEHRFHAQDIKPMLTYGTNPGMAMAVDSTVPSDAESKALSYMDIKSGESLIHKKIQHVFIGSCTNSRIEDLREVAAYVTGKQKADHISAMIVPGSKMVSKQAEEEGLDKIFLQAGFQWREPGCSACLGMNEDKIPSGEYCISTSNRNFEGRQGPGARTILASPLMAAAAAISGKIVDIRNIEN